MMPVLAVLYTAAVLFISWQTELSICFLLGMKSTYGCTYIGIAVCAFLLVLHEVKDPSWGRPWIKRIIGFVCCLFIYYAMLTAMWGLIGLLLSIDSMVIAVGTLIMAGMAVLIVLLGYLYTNIIRKRVYSVKVGTAGAIYRIALMSDIHLGAHVGVRYVQRIVRAVNELSADLVVIAGDLFDEDNAILKDGAALEKISQSLRGIRAKDGVYFAPGNHDPKATNELFLTFLEDGNIRLLHNDITEFPNFNLIGRSDAARNTRAPLTELMQRADPEKVTVVIDHDPKGIPEAAEQGVELVLCGHTHAGQLFPGNVFTKLANGKRFFYGHEVFGNTHGIISSGVGIFNLPVRVGTSNEILEIRLGI